MRERWVALGLFATASIGLVFTAYLTYLEAFVIHAWCQWCVVSAVLIAVIFLVRSMSKHLKRVPPSCDARAPPRISFASTYGPSVTTTPSPWRPRPASAGRSSPAANSRRSILPVPDTQRAA